MAILESKNTIFHPKTSSDITSCFETMKELRPHLITQEDFTSQIERQLSEGYNLASVVQENEVAACIGYRIFETLAWGKILYIDDLVTKEKFRKRGLAKELMTYTIEQAKISGCAQVHLDSGHHRFDAHRFYLNLGLKITCHHFAIIL